MIARIWHCTALPENVAAYVAHFEGSVLPDLRALEGFIEGTILRRDDGSQVHLTVITLWESMDVIRRFAGDSADVAVVAPHAQAILETFERTVTHSQVIFRAEPLT